MNRNKKLSFYRNTQFRSCYDVCDAQGQRRCELTVGLDVVVIDPELPKQKYLFGVAVPEADEDTAWVRIPVRYMLNGINTEIFPPNRVVFENAMEYVYRLFDGKISKEELDSAIAEIIEKGKNDRTMFDIFNRYKDAKGEARFAETIELGKAAYFPEVKMEKVFNGETYVFDYGNYLGNVHIKFSLSRFLNSSR